MDLTVSPRAAEIAADVDTFVRERIEPAEAEITRDYAAMRARGENSFVVHPKIDELKAQAREAGLWNLFLPAGEHGDEWAARFGTRGGKGFSNVDYAAIAEKTGRTALAPLIFNCNAPDTGNMEVLTLFGTDEHKERYLGPLLAGEMASAFAMTEPAVASSDATNVETSMVRDGDEYVINGRKWWTSNALHQNCKVLIVMGKTDPDAPTHRQQSMMVVPINAPGVKILRGLPVFGYWDREGHAEVEFDHVRVPREALLAGEGDGFMIAQSRLGPGRIHHCMRSIGQAQRALEYMARRVDSRVAFGRKLADQSSIRQEVALSFCEIEQARLLVLKTAWLIDNVGSRGAATEIAATGAPSATESHSTARPRLRRPRPK